MSKIPKSDILILFFMTILLSLSPRLPAKDYDCVTPVNPIQIDGNVDDWNNIPVNYFEDDQVGVAVANDADNLYLLLRFPDAQWARQIRMMGLTLWVDQKGGKKQVFGLRYNGGPSDEEPKNNLPDKMKARLANMSDEQKQQVKDRMGSRPVQLEIVDKKSDQAVPIKSDSLGPAAGFVFDEDFYCYEFRLPLQIVSSDYYGIDLRSNDKIGVGLEWGGMPDRDEMGGPPGGGGGMGGPPGGGEGGFGGGRPGGGPSGGGPGGGMGGFQRPEEKKIWFKIKLSGGESGKE